jgi:hypothetical protein
VRPLHGSSFWGSRRILKIGVDLDNTLLNYDAAFLQGARELGLIEKGWQGNKSQTKEHVRLIEGGEASWQKLQGQVYGRLIRHARIFDGAYRFLWRCQQRGIQVDIVSHKTEYGHGDTNKVPLREAALDFLSSQGMSAGAASGNLLRHVFFENTREQKIKRILKNEYDWFIDDLTDILEDPLLPPTLGRILMGGSSGPAADDTKICASWTEIGGLLLGAWTEAELLALAESVALTPITKVDLLAGGGNSGLYKVATNSGAKYVLKLYPEGAGHDRLSSEFDSFRLISESLSACIPRPFQKSRALSAAIYQWVEGEAVSCSDSGHIQQALKFVRALHQLRDMQGFKGFQNASAFFASGSAFEGQIRARFNTLLECSTNHPSLSEYLQNELSPTMEKVLDWTRKEWEIEPRYTEPLPRSKQTLSPSDFGFHNSLEQPSGQLCFLDFEYFGWDDPVKLIVDFCFHPGMSLSAEQQRTWVEGAIEIYGDDILDRLHLSWPMIALSWCLILLNEYRDDVWDRRRAANPDKSGQRPEILNAQLARSRALLTKISSNYSYPLLSKLESL